MYLRCWHADSLRALLGMNSRQIVASKGCMMACICTAICIAFTHMVCSVQYMAPEVVAGRGHGKAVDWWSIGILLYEMLCGTPPFRAQSRQKLQKQILTSKLKLPRKLQCSMPAFAYTCRAPDPALRWVSALSLRVLGGLLCQLFS